MVLHRAPHPTPPPGGGAPSFALPSPGGHRRARLPQTYIAATRQRGAVRNCEKALSAHVNPLIMHWARGQCWRRDQRGGLVRFETTDCRLPVPAGRDGEGRRPPIPSSPRASGAGRGGGSDAGCPCTYTEVLVLARWGHVAAIEEEAARCKVVGCVEAERLGRGRGGEGCRGKEE